MLPFHSVVHSLKSLYLFIFAFVVCTFSVTSKKSLPRPMLWSFTIMFPFRSFIVSGLTFNSFIYVELIFVCGVRWVQCYSFVCGYPAFPTAFVKEIFFFHCVVKDREAWDTAGHWAANSPILQLLFCSIGLWVWIFRFHIFILCLLSFSDQMIYILQLLIWIIVLP